jgi:hypothetical protein
MRWQCPQPTQGAKIKKSKKMASRFLLDFFGALPCRALFVFVFCLVFRGPLVLSLQVKRPSKRKVTGLDVVGWFLGGQKVTGLVSFFLSFLSCF